MNVENDLLGNDDHDEEGKQEHKNHGTEQHVRDAPLLPLAEVASRLSSRQLQRIRQLTHCIRLKVNRFRISFNLKNIPAEY